MGRASREKAELRELLSPPPWTPFQIVEPNGDIQGFEIMFKNSRYVVLGRRFPSPLGTGIHLSIRLNNRHHLRDWRDFQRIKNELVGEEAEAVELYPAESRVVDGANQFHLWCFEKFVGEDGKEHPARFPFGFWERDVAGPAEGHPGARQREIPDWMARNAPEPGAITGES